MAKTDAPARKKSAWKPERERLTGQFSAKKPVPVVAQGRQPEMIDARTYRQNLKPRDT